MNCSDFRELVAAYVDGQLSTAEAQAAERHLSVCRDCRSLVEENQEVRDAIRDHHVMVPMPEGLWPQTLAMLDEWVRGRARMRRMVFAVAGMAAVMVLAAVSYTPLQRALAPPVLLSEQGIVRDTVIPKEVRKTSHVGVAFSLVREHLDANVPPVNLSLIGGKLSSVTLYEDPPVGVLTYQLSTGAELRYFISRTSFRLTEPPESWTIGRTEVLAVCAPTHFTATWQDRGLSYAVLSDRVPPEPKAVLREFIDAMKR